MKFEYPKLYTDFAKYYDKLETQYRSYELETNWISSILSETKAKAILDISCGTASHMLGLAIKHPDCNFFATDASKEMIRVAAMKLGAHQVHILISDFLNPPFRLPSFELVICMYWSIAGLDLHLTARLFSNIASILKRGGLFIFDTENSRGIKEELLTAPFIDASFQSDEGIITRVNHSRKISDDVVDWRSYYLIERASTTNMIADRMKLTFYSREQIEHCLDEAGFTMENIFSAGLREYYESTPTLYFVAKKR